MEETCLSSQAHFVEAFFPFKKLIECRFRSHVIIIIKKQKRFTFSRPIILFSLFFFLRFSKFASNFFSSFKKFKTIIFWNVTKYYFSSNILNRTEFPKFFKPSANEYFHLAIFQIFYLIERFFRKLSEVWFSDR